MSQGADAPAPIARPGRFWTRAGVLASILGTLVFIWASHAYLTRSFSEEQNTDATVRATLYAGAIQSTMQRHSVVPLLLSRDPILILALRSGTYDGAEERLADFREEIGAGSIFLLDAQGRIVAASDERPREQYDGDKAYFTAAVADPGTVFSIIENDDGAYSFHYARRIMQDEKLLGVVVVTVDLEPAGGGLAAGRGQGRRHRQRGPGAARLRADLAAADAVEPARAGQLGPRAPGAARGPPDLRRAGLRLYRRHAAPLDRGAGRLPQLAADLLRDARGRAGAGERDPVADHHDAGAPARAHLLPAVAADPRREPAHPARVRGAAGC